MGKMKKLVSVLLALCMLVLPASGVLAQADFRPDGDTENYFYFSSDDWVSVKAEQQYYIDCTITTNDTVYAIFRTDTIQDLYVCVTNASTNKILGDSYGTIRGGDPGYWGSYGDGTYGVVVPLPSSLKGTKVRVAVTLEEKAAKVQGALNTKYTQGMESTKSGAKEKVAATEKMMPKMSSSSEKITVGFTTKLSVSGYEGTVKWSSNKKPIATVNSKGKVTAKKTGSCKIKATLESGTVLTCKINVKKNVYTDTVGSTPGRCTIGVTNLKFTNKGHLQVKYQIVNGTAYPVTKLSGIKISIYDKNGKLIGTYSKSSADCSIASGSKKTFTVTIKKKNLKKKKADLRLISDIDFDGQYYYSY